MAKPPPATPHSDIDGVNRDARAGKPHDQPWPDPGAALADAKDESTARPAQSTPLGAEERDGSSPRR